MNQTVGETRREMKQKFRSMGEHVWLQETFRAARGSGNKAFVGLMLMMPFASPADLHPQGKLAVGAVPAHSCSHSLSLQASHIAKTGWNMEPIPMLGTRSYTFTTISPEFSCSDSLLLDPLLQKGVRPSRNAYMCYPSALWTLSDLEFWIKPFSL